MQKHKKTKRTHFDNTIRYANAILNYELRTKSYELFTKRTHFTLCGSLCPCGKKTKRTQISIFQSKTHFRKTNPFLKKFRTPSIYNLQFPIYNYKTNPFSINYPVLKCKIVLNRVQCRYDEI
jgi:hypothetical protein